MSLVIMFYFTSSMLNMFSDINTSIIRSLRLFYCITTLVVCSCFDVAGLGWYLCSRLKHNCYKNATPNLIFEYFSKIRIENSSFIQI